MGVRLTPKVSDSAISDRLERGGSSPLMIICRSSSATRACMLVC